MLRAHGPFRGICRGGPWDHVHLVHDRPTYRVAYLPALSILLTFDKEPNDTLDLKWGTYRHVLEQWIWRDDADHQNVRMP